MARKKPSGAGSNSRRFADVTRPDGTTLKVPVVKDAATFIYVSENGEWPADYTCKLLYDATWMQDNVVFELEEVGAGMGMGETRTVQVLEVRNTVMVDRSGKYTSFGQTIKRVLVALVADATDLEEVTAEDLDEHEWDVRLPKRRKGDV